MAVSAALLTLVIGIVTTLALHVDNPWSLDESLDPTLNLFQYVGIAGAAGTVLAFFNALHAWRSPSRGFLGRLKETAVALSCAALTWFAWAMNLFDFSLRY